MPYSHESAYIEELEWESLKAAMTDALKYDYIFHN